MEFLDRICSREIVSSKAQRIRSIFFSSSNESVEHIKGISCDIFMENIDCMISDASKYYEVSKKKLFIGSFASQHLSEVGMFTTKTSAFSISEFNPILFRFISLTKSKESRFHEISVNDVKSCEHFVSLH